MASKSDVKTLWVGDLDQWCDDAYLYNIFQSNAHNVTSVKVIRDKNNNMPAGYGFVEFASAEVASRIIQSHNGQPIPNYPGKNYRLNWAQFGINETKKVVGPQFSVFVGDLAAEVTDAVLESTFTEQYASRVVGARVVTDPATLRSKGYGFVRFDDETTSLQAITEMQGTFLLSRRMRISSATPKKATTGTQDLTGTQVAKSSQDRHNCTVFVGNLTLTDEQVLRAAFEPFGDITRVKIIEGKGCGFVDFVHREHAEKAIEMMHGSELGTCRVRLSWGKQSGGGSTSTPPAPTPAPAPAPHLQYQQQQAYNYAATHAASATATAAANTAYSQWGGYPQQQQQQQPQQPHADYSAWYAAQSAHHQPDPATAAAWQAYYQQQQQHAQLPATAAKPANATGAKGAGGVRGGLLDSQAGKSVAERNEHFIATRAAGFVQNLVGVRDVEGREGQHPLWVL